MLTDQEVREVYAELPAALPQTWVKRYADFDEWLHERTQEAYLRGMSDAFEQMGY